MPFFVELNEGSFFFFLVSGFRFEVSSFAKVCHFDVRRNHTRKSTKIGNFLYGISCVISLPKPRDRNDKIVWNLCQSLEL